MTQKEALDVMKMGHNVFLTGAAGSGKTHTISQYIDYLKKNDIGIAITASTGIAATHIGGMTIHAWSGLGVRSELTSHDIDELESRQYLWKRYEATQVLIIDEVSMLHDFRLDLIDRLCRAFKRNEDPFGGMQIILCGDFFQLPPVTRFGEGSADFIHGSRVWREMGLKICYLEEQHRQNDEKYLSILNAIRNNEVEEDIYELLTSRFNAVSDGKIIPTKLYTHNIDVDAENDLELAKIQGVGKEYKMDSHGSKGLVETLKKTCLAPEKLFLKKGARVMFVKNNYEKGYANGTLGEVVAFDSSGFPIVEVASGKRITVGAESWRVEEEGKVRAEILQIPLRLAWAITVHKSQGLSLDAAEINLSKSFVSGMGYVALSRVRSLEGLRLLGLNRNALTVNESVLEFDRYLKQESEKLVTTIEHLGKKEIEGRQQEFLKKISPSKKSKEEKLPTHYKTKLLIAEKLPLKDIAEAREMSIDTIISHVEKLIEESKTNGVDLDFDIEYLRKGILSDAKLESILNAFKESFQKHGDYRLAPVKYKLGNSCSYVEIRLAGFISNKYK